MLIMLLLNSQLFSLDDSMTMYCSRGVNSYFSCVVVSDPEVHDAVTCLLTGRQVSSEGEILDYRRMLMEDFSLSPEIILSGRGEIEHHCSGLHRKGRTLHCLMKVVRGEKGNLGMNCQQAVRTHFLLPFLMLKHFIQLRNLLFLS